MSTKTAHGAVTRAGSSDTMARFPHCMDARAVQSGPRDEGAVALGHARRHFREAVYAATIFYVDTEPVRRLSRDLRSASRHQEAVPRIPNFVTRISTLSSRNSSSSGATATSNGPGRERVQRMASRRAGAGPRRAHGRLGRRWRNFSSAPTPIRSAAAR